ncbi:MAG TPA: hypothetical protein VMV47_17670 [Bacteroidales bacterium]|nr:hypothetical protein [Bacteroidales bacterium]
MKRIVFILTGFILLSVFRLSAQEYSAIRYWNMEQDKTFITLVERQNKGEILTSEEQKSLDDYRMKLIEYFVRMPDSEKAIYYQNRASWKENQQNIYNVPQQGTDVYSGERSKFTQYLITNGIFGAFYGGATSFIMGVEDGRVATGIALLTAGGSVLIPVLSIKDRYVSYNSLSLTNHGKLIGAGQGLALGVLIVGDNVDEGKLLVTLSELSSITLGRVGYALGKNRPWSEGRAKLYTYYGTLMPFEGLALAAAFESENPRIYGLSALAFGAGGYFMADAIAKQNDITRGDLTATATLATLHGMLGFGIMSDIAENSEYFHSGSILLPAIGALGASMAGHYWLKDAKFTNQQGRNVALASAGGSIIGLGLIAIVGSDDMTPYYISGYITGMTTYALMINSYKKKNNFSLPAKEMKTGWNFNFTPQNIFYNRKMASYYLSNPGKRIDMLPAFSATLTF